MTEVLNIAGMPEDRRSTVDSLDARLSAEMGNEGCPNDEEPIILGGPPVTEVVCESTVVASPEKT